MVMLGHDGCEACAPEIARLQAECRRLREDVATWQRRAKEATADAPVALPKAVRERLAEVALEFVKQQRHDLQEVVNDLWSLLQGTYLAALKQQFGPTVVATEAPPLRPSSQDATERKDDE